MLIRVFKIIRQSQTGEIDQELNSAAEKDSRNPAIYYVCNAGVGNVGPEGRCPAEFSSIPNQTHLNKLIKVFRNTRATGRWGLFQGWS